MAKIPNFIIAGFPKCGTSSLYAYLKTHPEIFLPERKEMNFFTYNIISSKVEGKGDKLVSDTQVSTWKKYLSYYSDVGHCKVIGEASPSYINFPECFDEVNEKLNNPKVIIILRDPIKRAFSNYLHLVRMGRESLSFEDAINAEEQRITLNYSPFWYYKKHSIYYTKIVSAQDKFSEVLIITQEALKNETTKTLKSVFKFLEVNEKFVPGNLNVTYNKGGVYKRNVITNFLVGGSKFRNYLIEKLPFIKKLKPIKDSVLKRFAKSPPEINLKTENYLIEYFKDDVKKLKTLGIKVDDWNPKYFS